MKKTASLALACALLAGLAGPAAAREASPSTTKPFYGPGRIVPLPASIPHEAGDMVDRRIIPDLRWIAQRYPIFVTDGYSGPLPDGTQVGCRGCHVRNSDHYNGLAVDLVPIGGGSRCDASWAPITRLSLWAEPRQNHPVLPFRWVGYDGDAGHGCGHHLHLSWNHAPARMFQLAEWVEVFPVSPAEELTESVPGKKKRPPKRKAKPQHQAPPKPAGPAGGISLAPTGGIAARSAGD